MLNLLHVHHMRFQRRSVMKPSNRKNRTSGTWRWLLKGVLIFLPLISDASELDAGEADPSEESDSDSQGGRTIMRLVYSLLEWLV
jgi:hypothetical protein